MKQFASATNLPFVYSRRGLTIQIDESKDSSGMAAARLAAAQLKAIIAEKGQARFVAATGASQLNFLAALAADTTIPWQKTTMFNLDDYLALDRSHPASFSRYLQERLVDKVRPGTVHLVNGENPDAWEECRRLGAWLDEYPIDLLFCGIGENCHLAFNDPPADFAATESYLVVQLDEACRRQQFGEGWFPSLEDVPRQAISMSIPAILRAQRIICIVSETRKAAAVAGAVEGTISPDQPASILQRHPDTTLFLDQEAAALLTRRE